MRKIASYALAAIWPLALFGAGTQTITLRNGNQFHGTMINGSATSITFQDDNGRSYQFNPGEVQSINFASDGFNNSGVNNNGGQGYNNPNGYNGPRNSQAERDRWIRQNGNGNANGNRGGFGDANANPGVNGNANGNPNGNFGNAGNNNFGNAGNNNNGNSNSANYRNLPTGTELSVRTNETIDSRSAADGRTYSAVISKDVLDANGNVAIPQGSDAQLVVKSMNGGNIASSSNLVLDVKSVTLNGQRYMVNTQDIQQQAGRQGVGANRRTAEIVGGGTALGTLLGAIGGGGRGALIGAIAGAAAGTGVEVLTKGKEVRVPSETVLNFRLDQPMQLSPAY